MKVAALFVALAAATANAFAPASSGNVRSGSALSMAMERTYIMVRRLQCHASPVIVM